MADIALKRVPARLASLYLWLAEIEGTAGARLNRAQSSRTGIAPAGSAFRTRIGVQANMQILSKSPVKIDQGSRTI